MAIRNREIGWNNEANLYWQISKQLDRLIKVMGSLTATTTTTAIPTTTTTTF